MERINRGAFTEALAQAPDVVALFNHDTSLVVGRSTAGTLRLSEDETGLRYEIDVADTTTGRDLLTSVRRGDVNGSSFAFTVAPGGEEWVDEDGTNVRYLSKLNLLTLGL